MYAKDTIAAVATPPGTGAIGIVRLSGPDALAIAARLFVAADPSRKPAPRLQYGHVVEESGELIDEVLLLRMPGPQSYTGEDCVEIHCHGNPLVLRRVLARCLELGARAAEPGELTKRAFLNGRLDLVQAEAVAELISAKTDAAARTGLRHLSGALSQELAAIRDVLVELKAHAEVLIDFSEEEIDLRPEQLLAAVDAASARIAKLLATFATGSLLRNGLHVALVGRPNVGKSSLLNALLRRDRAIVTPIPGTTRDVITESIDIGGIPVVLADTAGLRQQPDEIEQLGIERSRQQAAEADVVLAIFDLSSPLVADDRSVLDSLADAPRLLVANKRDLPAAWAAQDLGAEMIEVSALTGAGLEDLRRAVVELAGGDRIDPAEPVLTLVRHRDALQRAAESLRLVRASIEGGAPMDATAVDIQTAVEHIGGITGEVTTDEVLDRIFREFCIGK